MIERRHVGTGKKSKEVENRTKKLEKKKKDIYITENKERNNRQD